MSCPRIEIEPNSIASLGCSVSNLDRSIKFYRNIVELELLSIIECPPEMGLENVAGMPGCDSRIGKYTRILNKFDFSSNRV